MRLLSLHTWMKDYWSYHTSQAETTRRQCQQTQDELIAGRTKMSYRDWPLLKNCEICKKKWSCLQFRHDEKEFFLLASCLVQWGPMRPNCASLSLWWSQGPWKKNSGSPHYSMAICWSCMKETLPFLNGCFELFMPASEKWGPQQSWFKCMCLSRGVERIEHRGLASNASLDGTVAFPGGHGEPWAHRVRMHPLLRLRQRLPPSNKQAFCILGITTTLSARHGFFTFNSLVCPAGFVVRGQTWGLAHLQSK